MTCMKMFSVEWNSCHTEVEDTKGVHSPKSSASNVHPTRLFLWLPSMRTTIPRMHQSFTDQENEFFQWAGPAEGRVRRKFSQWVDCTESKPFFDCTKGIGIFGAFVLVEVR